MSTTIQSLPQTAPSGLPLFADRVGDCLFQAGYLASVRNDLTLWIETPENRTYIVNPRMDTCTCEAGRRGNPCKHRRGLCDLVFLSVQFWFSVGEGIAAKQLNDWWWEFTIEGGRKQ